MLRGYAAVTAEVLSGLTGRFLLTTAARLERSCSKSSTVVRSSAAHFAATLFRKSKLRPQSCRFYMVFRMLTTELNYVIGFLINATPSFQLS